MGGAPERITPRNVPETRVQPALYGREADIKRLAASTDSVVLLTGDSGVGKSEVLTAAQAATTFGIAPAPVTVGHPSGSLQNALLEGLARATAELVEQRGVTAALGERIKQAALAVARDRGERLAQVVATELLNVVKARVGQEVGQALGDYVKELRAAGDEALEARIRGQMDPSVAEITLALAREVVELAGDEGDVVLALDAVEQLGEEDRRLLTDVIAAVPEGLHLRLGFATYTAEHQDHVEDLLAATDRTVEQRLLGIGTEPIAQWVSDAGVDPSTAPAVHRVTDGYPLVVGDVIEHLRGGGELSDAPRPGQFIRRTQQAWRDLDPGARAVARRMVVLSEPLPEAALQELCGLDAAAWGDAVERLWRARILSTYVNGIPWFHEQRRHAILQILRPDERAQLYVAAAEATLGLSIETRIPRLAADVSALVVAGSSALTTRPQLGAAVSVGRTELAVAAALIEMFEPSSGRPLDADDVLRHARSFFGGKGNLVPALETLEARGLVEVATSDSQVMLRPKLDALTEATVQGRALSELGRLPLPGLASSVFSAAIHPRLEPYEHAIHGLGPGSLTELGEMASLLAAEPFGPYAGRGEGHFLLVRAEFHGRPLAGAVRFSETTDRDAAMRRLERMRIEVFGGPLDITAVIPHPAVALPANRYVDAVARLGIRTRAGYADSLSRRLAQPLPAELHASRKVETVALVRRLASEDERRVLDLDEGMRLHWHYSEDVLVEGEAHGGGEVVAVRHDEVPTVSHPDPYEWFRFADAFALTERERLAHLRFHAGEPLVVDPVVEMLGRLRSRVARWNHYQRRVHVPVEQTRLQALLLEARRRELSDARAFAAAGVLGEGEEPGPRALFVAVHDDPAPEFPPALSVAWRDIPSPSGEEEVHIAYVPTRPAPFRLPGRPDEVFNSAFGLDFDSAGGTGGDGSASSVIAAHLGHREEDILLVRDDGTPADAF